MKAFSKVTNHNLFFAAILACLIAAGSVSALAVPANQVLRVQFNQTFQGKCCFLWGETVRVTEPSVIAPVVVTWSTDYRSNAPFLSGLSVNGGPCMFFGSGSIPASSASDGTFGSRTFQWLIFPNDGLLRGTNTFTLCGGGVFANTDSITLGFNTLAVRLSK
jgi:hypothetical protein